MIARLLLAAILALAAIPAAAPVACHDGAIPTTMAGMDDHVPAKATPPHACIGCVPPGDWLGARLAERMPPARPSPTARVVTLALGPSVPPALPPPRAA